MPKFYVVVTFIPVPDDSHQFVGGEPSRSRGKPFIRISIAHIHVKLPNDKEVYAGMTARIDAVLKPHIEAKGYDSEYHIDETER